MIMVAPARPALVRRDARRARHLADMALSGTRMMRGLSAATPGPRAFVRAGVCSLAAWGVLLLVATAL